MSAGTDDGTGDVREFADVVDALDAERAELLLDGDRCTPLARPACAWEEHTAARTLSAGDGDLVIYRTDDPGAWLRSDAFVSLENVE